MNLPNFLIKNLINFKQFFSLSQNVIDYHLSIILNNDDFIINNLSLKKWTIQKNLLIIWNNNTIELLFNCFLINPQTKLISNWVQ